MASEGIGQWRHMFWLSLGFLKVYVQKLTGNNIIFRIRLSLWLHLQRKDGANLTRQRPTHQKAVAAIMMLYRNMKVKVRSPNGYRLYIDIEVGVLQRDTLAPYFFIICLDHVPWTSIDWMNENGFKLTKEIWGRYLAQTITDVNYADDTTLLANTSAQAEILLHSLKQAAAGIGLYCNAHKTEYICFNQTGDISTLMIGCWNE